MGITMGYQLKMFQLDIKWEPRMESWHDHIFNCWLWYKFVHQQWTCLLVGYISPAGLMIVGSEFTLKNRGFSKIFSRIPSSPLSYQTPPNDTMVYKVVPQFVSIQLVYKYYNVWVYDTQITIVHGVYKPTYNWGAPPCTYVNPLLNHGFWWSVSY